MNWLERAAAGIDRVDTSIIMPTDKEFEGVVVGKLEGKLLKLFTLYALAKSHAEQVDPLVESLNGALSISELLLGKDNPIPTEVTKKLISLPMQFVALRAIFVASVDRAFDSWDAEDFHIGKDFQVYANFPDKKSRDRKRHPSDVFWLDGFIEALGKLDIDCGVSPSTDREKNEVYCGSASDNLRRLYIASIIHQRALVEARSSHAISKVVKGQNELEKRVSFLREQEIQEAVSQIFRVSMVDEYNLWGRGQVGIRKGWMVVEVHPNKVQRLEDYEMSKDLNSNIIQ